MAFSGAELSNPDKYLPYRERIWNHLEKMIDSNRLKTVPQVIPELAFNDHKSYTRILPRKDKFVLPAEHQIEIGALNIISRYPTLIDKNQSYTRDPADPYIVVYAKRWNASIICDEKPLAERTGVRKFRRLNIPDICQNENNMLCQSLEKYLKGQGIIPIDYSP